MIDATMYCQMIGSLMYLTNTRVDICFALNTLRHVHLMVVKHAMRYLNGTFEYGLKYEVSQKINLEGYVDLYWEGSAIDRKSTSRCYFNMGSSVIFWFRRMESCMVLSTSEEKDVATFYLGERSSESLVCDLDRDLSKEGVLAQSVRHVV